MGLTPENAADRLTLVLGDKRPHDLTIPEAAKRAVVRGGWADLDLGLDARDTKQRVHSARYELRKLGFVFDRTTYECANPTFRPTADDLAALRAGRNQYVPVAERPPATPRPTPSGPSTNGATRKRPRGLAPFPFPAPGVPAVVRLSGYDAEGVPVLVVGVPGVGVYECTITRARAEAPDAS